MGAESRLDSDGFPVRRIAFVAFPDVQVLDVTGPLQVFATANRLLREAGCRPRYVTQVVAGRAGPVMSSAGVTLQADGLPDGDIDTLVVAGGEGVTAASADAALVGWVAAQAGRVRRLASVCTGAFLLAMAGVLDGRRATTHWAYCRTLAARFPRIRVETDPIHVVDGPIWTSAGVTAGIDMALAMLEADCGRRLAADVARHLVVFAKRPGGQAQFSIGLQIQAGAADFDTLHDWMRANPRVELSVPVLAERMGMSERTFLRRYRKAIGLTPARVVEQIRVEAARQALADAGCSIKRAARAAGFGSEETMRRSFLRVLAVSPQAYRERFPV